MLKLALGTVQFGLPYGINNKSGLPTDVELMSLFKLAKESGIEVLDSAQGYGNAEERIGKLSNNEFRIVTKFKKIESSYLFNKELNESLNKLNLDFVYGYMAHDGDLLIENPSWWIELMEVKNRGLVKKIGYSLYSIKQLESLLEKQIIPDIIQFPYNVLDRSFEPYMSELINLGVEIHTRSVYLQGLLQMDYSMLPSNLGALKPSLKQLCRIADKHGVSVGELCLGFAISNPSINKVVIGVDSENQLAENIKFSKNAILTKELINELNTIEVNDTSLLDPSTWK
jgi:aryl-alcohol dehydrogenase-like predicted oxidoreductase